MNQVYFFLAFVIATLSCPAAPSVVTLDSNEQLVGEILPRSNEQTLVVQSELLGVIEVPRARVAEVRAHTVQPVEVAPTPAPVPAPAPVAAAPAPVPAQEETDEERRIVDTLREFKAPDDWSGNVRFGVNLSQGDRRWTETYARGKLEIKPQGSPNFYRFSGSYTYRETERGDGSRFRSTDKYDVEFIYRRTFLDDWFLQNALGGRVDEIKGIEHEIQDTLGVGYRFKPSDKFEILFGGGGGLEEYQTDFEDTREGLNPIVNVFQEATWRPFSRTSFVQKFNYYLNPDDSNQFNYVFTAAIRVRLTDLLGLEFSYNRSFDNDVGNGNPQDDIQWRNALVVYF